MSVLDTGAEAGIRSALLALSKYYLCANNIRPMPVYAITTSPSEFGKPPYQSIYLYESTDFKYDSEGNAIRCGEMLLRLRPDENTIQLASVECNCSEVKGHCFEYLLSILIREGCYGTELFGQQLTPTNPLRVLFKGLLGCICILCHRLGNHVKSLTSQIA